MTKPQDTLAKTISQEENEHLKITVVRLLDSRKDVVGDEDKPQSLVETFWLEELARVTGYHDERI